MSLEDLRNAGVIALKAQERHMEKLESLPPSNALIWAKALAALHVRLAGEYQWDEFAEACDVGLPIALQVSNQERELDQTACDEITTAWTWMCGEFGQSPDSPVDDVVDAVLAESFGS